MEAFASQVTEAARTSQTGRFGIKTFIGHVHREYVRATGSRLDLEHFKACLVEAQRAGLVKLSRADMPEAMDPADVAESRTQIGPDYAASVHFVRVA